MAKTDRLRATDRLEAAVAAGVDREAVDQAAAVLVPAALAAGVGVLQAWADRRTRISTA